MISGTILFLAITYHSDVVLGSCGLKFKGSPLTPTAYYLKSSSLSPSLLCYCAVSLWSASPLKMKKNKELYLHGVFQPVRTAVLYGYVCWNMTSKAFRLQQSISQIIVFVQYFFLFQSMCGLDHSYGRSSSCFVYVFGFFSLLNLPSSTFPYCIMFVLLPISELASYVFLHR